MSLQTADHGRIPHPYWRSPTSSQTLQPSGRRRCKLTSKSESAHMECQQPLAAESRPALWEAVQREAADIVLLQEVRRLPEELLSSYNCHFVRPRYFSGHDAPFATAILSKWEMVTRPFLKSQLGWVNQIQSQHHGWILESEVNTHLGIKLRVVSVHSPAFPIPAETLLDADVSCIKLPNNPASGLPRSCGLYSETRPLQRR